MLLDVDYQIDFSSEHFSLTLKIDAILLTESFITSCKNCVVASLHTTN